MLLFRFICFLYLILLSAAPSFVVGNAAAQSYVFGTGIQSSYHDYSIATTDDVFSDDNSNTLDNLPSGASIKLLKKLSNQHSAQTIFFSLNYFSPLSSPPSQIAQHMLSGSSNIQETMSASSNSISNFHQPKLYSSRPSTSLFCFSLKQCMQALYEVENFKSTHKSPHHSYRNVDNNIFRGNSHTVYEWDLSSKGSYSQILYQLQKALHSPSDDFTKSSSSIIPSQLQSKSQEKRHFSENLVTTSTVELRDNVKPAVVPTTTFAPVPTLHRIFWYPPLQLSSKPPSQHASKHLGQLTKRISTQLFYQPFCQPSFQLSFKPSRQPTMRPIAQSYFHSIPDPSKPLSYEYIDKNIEIRDNNDVDKKLLKYYKRHL